MQTLGIPTDETSIPNIIDFGKILGLSDSVVQSDGVESKLDAEDTEDDEYHSCILFEEERDSIAWQHSQFRF